MNMVTIDKVKDWLFALSDIYSENREYLTELDSAIGDADHGINLDRGFSAVRAEIEKMSSGGVQGAAGQSPDSFSSLKNCLHDIDQNSGGSFRCPAWYFFP